MVRYAGRERATLVVSPSPSARLNEVTGRRSKTDPRAQLALILMMDLAVMQLEAECGGWRWWRRAWTISAGNRFRSRRSAPGGAENEEEESK